MEMNTCPQSYLNEQPYLLITFRSRNLHVGFVVETIQEGQPFSFPEGHELVWNCYATGAQQFAWTHALFFLSHSPSPLFESLSRASIACPLPLCALWLVSTVLSRVILFPFLLPCFLSFFSPFSFPFLLFSALPVPRSLFSPLSVSSGLRCSGLHHPETWYEFDLRFVLPAATAPTQRTSWL